ncbi:heme peroxidase [Paraburkholderia silvatlantica]|uniref:Heme peroxidase n=2 Tax=Paraburkholderia silvatlantica TaxID=321895 RepID=A0A2V4TJ10_9BURK|nr:peroxidase family protein [Paraburkholderia silvatlantica]PYE14090.1 heme peroxidase [Paraburkholderia silvatlantica]
MDGNGHGFITQQRQIPFTNLFPLRDEIYPASKLLALSKLMQGAVDTVKDGPDPEENLWLPAGYTYFSQFVDHDLTFDSTSSLDPALALEDKSRVPTNLRTPRLDLDCIYGDGPAAQPFMYAADGATLLYGGTGQPQLQANPNGLVASVTATWDLLRAPNGRAIIGDKRNDENSIVCQIQLAMIKYHNKIVELLSGENSDSWLVAGDIFESARTEVRWTYQRIVVEDFLPRIIREEVLNDLQGLSFEQRKKCYVLYPDKDGIRDNLPREFVAAAYRYGHSGVRTGYRLNPQTRLSIFPASNQADQSADSLLGFDPLPQHHIIDDWGRFFPDSDPGADIGEPGRIAADDTPDPSVRLQFAYKLDPTLVDPLTVLPPGVAGSTATSEAKEQVDNKLPNPDRPSLALLNLLRGNAYRLVSGQTVAEKLQAAGKGTGPLPADRLVVRLETDERPENDADPKSQAFKWTPIDPDLQTDTPLWFYILAEAQAPILDTVTGGASRVFSENDLLNGAGALTQLGWVGGRIVAEVIYGILDSDADSYVRASKGSAWNPRFATDGPVRMRGLLDFIVKA